MHYLFPNGGSTCLGCSVALDTAALLGGKEYLVAQILEDLAALEFTQGEKSCLQWALQPLWSEHLTTGDIDQIFLQPDGPHYLKSPYDLTAFVTGYNINKLPRKCLRGRGFMLGIDGHKPDRCLCSNSMNLQFRVHTSKKNRYKGLIHLFFMLKVPFNKI